MKGCLPSKFSSIKGCLPSKVIFHQRSSSITGCLPSMAVFPQRSASIKDRLPFYCIKCAIRFSRMFPCRLLAGRKKQLIRAQACALLKNSRFLENFTSIPDAAFQRCSPSSKILPVSKDYFSSRIVHIVKVRVLVLIFPPRNCQP